MAYEGWQANVQAYNDTLKMVLSYECGGRQPDDSLRDALNGTRIDLSKVGCSNQPFFLASYNEIVQAREGRLRREKLSDIPMFRMNVEGAAATPNAAIWFVLVNGLGLPFLCARTVVRWVHRGLQEYLTRATVHGRYRSKMRRRFLNRGLKMRWIAFLCFFCFSTAALALEDCNGKFPNMGQLEDRLKCLQSNNNSLQSQIDALKTRSSGEHAIAKPETKSVAKPVVKPIAKPMTKPHVTPPQPLTRADCKKAGMQWNSNANVCGGR